MQRLVHGLGKLDRSNKDQRKIIISVNLRFQTAFRCDEVNLPSISDKTLEGGVQTPTFYSNVYNMNDLLLFFRSLDGRTLKAY